MQNRIALSIYGLPAATDTCIRRVATDYAEKLNDLQSRIEALQDELEKTQGNAVSFIKSNLDHSGAWSAKEWSSALLVGFTQTNE